MLDLGGNQIRKLRTISNGYGQASQQASYASHLGGNWEKYKAGDFFSDKQANRQAMPLHLGGIWKKCKAGDFFLDKQAMRPSRTQPI